MDTDTTQGLDHKGIKAQYIAAGKELKRMVKVRGNMGGISFGMEAYGRVLVEKNIAYYQGYIDALNAVAGQKDCQITDPSFKRGSGCEAGILKVD